LRDSQRLAAQAVGQVLAGRNLTGVLQRVWREHPGLSGQQRATIQDLSYGTLRHFGLLNAELGLLLEKPSKDALLRQLLLVALYQLQFSQAPAHAIVDQAVKAAVAAGRARAKGLVNAVLRGFLRRREQVVSDASQDVAARTSHPDWWIGRLQREYPAHWEAILEANNQHPPMTLRVNPRRVSAEDYLGELAGAGIDARQLGAQAILLARPVPVDRLPHFAEGWVSVQDYGAQRAAELLDVHDGMRVLDACSAPGGKAAHLLERARIDLTALDSDGERLGRVGQNLQRLQQSAHLITGDAATPDAWWDGVPFDRVLADVPCSASGVVRRHPDIKWLRRESDIVQFAAQQRAILDALWRCLARGGKLLYATCSIFAEENKLQIDAFLERHEDAKLLPLSGETIPPDGQLIPNDLHDGFYYALLAKD
jgi:16S rRNA (cytosine967-C5)-methyltransferase